MKSISARFKVTGKLVLFTISTFTTKHGKGEFVSGTLKSWLLQLDTSIHCSIPADCNFTCFSIAHRVFKAMIPANPATIVRSQLGMFAGAYSSRHGYLDGFCWEPCVSLEGAFCTWRLQRHGWVGAVALPVLGWVGLFFWLPSLGTWDHAQPFRVHMNSITSIVRRFGMMAEMYHRGGAE
jgi:hypothetical protein